MRINKYVALATGMSRRAADAVIESGRVQVNQQPVSLGQVVGDHDVITLDYKPVSLPTNTITIMLNKPVGYVCSRDGQGSQTIYDLLPPAYHHLKPVGRLDKDSSGLLLLTNNGKLAHELTHPSFQKEKVYEVELGKPLATEAKAKLEQGVMLSDGLSQLQLDGSDKNWTITMHEGRNRQIRRTFVTLGYQVTKLHRTKFGGYQLGDLQLASYQAMRDQ